jgi:hypothetical protein
MAAFAIGDANHLLEIRSMAGGPSITEITPTRLLGYLDDAKDWVELGTGVDLDNILISEKGYSNFKDAVTFRASVLIRYGWRDKENKAQEHSVEARRLINEIIKSSEQATSIDSTSSHLTQTEYNTPNMIESSQNPGLPYQSPDFSF